MLSNDVGRQVNLLFIQGLILLLFFRPKDIDPCTNVTCDYHAICKAFSAFDARCVCDDNCPSYEEPVCSSNSTTFKNKCFCLLDICQRKSNHTLYHPGSCTGKILRLCFIASFLPTAKHETIQKAWVRIKYCFCFRFLSACPSAPSTHALPIPMVPSFFSSWYRFCLLC